MGGCLSSEPTARAEPAGRGEQVVPSGGKNTGASLQSTAAPASLSSAHSVPNTPHTAPELTRAPSSERGGGDDYMLLLTQVRARGSQHASHACGSRHARPAPRGGRSGARRSSPRAGWVVRRGCFAKRARPPSLARPQQRRRPAARQPAQSPCSRPLARARPRRRARRPGLRAPARRARRLRGSGIPHDAGQPPC